MYGDTNAHHNWDGNRLSGDHSIARATGGKQTDRLMHLRCNAERGDGSKDHLRPALTGQPWQQASVDNRADWCRLDWWPTRGRLEYAQ